MKRTTISMPDELSNAVAREARRRGVSVSELTREALSRLLGLDSDQPRELPFAALGRSGHSTTGRDIEQLIDQEWDERPGRR